tara:strand:- start:1577 stop:2515 length:939 start_codon:yes stop_codon:yes gene_type:complete
MEEVEKQLFSIFSSFIRDLSKTYPEIKNCLYRNYEDCIINSDKPIKDFPKLQKFLDLIQEYEKYITDKNSEFFDLEIDLLEEISFKNLWAKNISGKTRETIWKYLQTFQIININLTSNAQLKEALSQIGSDTVMEVDKKTAKDLKKLKKLSKDVKEEVPSGESELEDMLGGLMDSGIGAIAKEVAETMDVEKMFGSVNENSNPMELMAQMMNPEKIGSIFQNINSVMEKKVESGELTQESLKQEANGMMGKMGDNDMFKNMMGQMNPEGMNNTTEPVQESAQESAQEPEPELSREEKSKRLKEKIAEKRKNR